MLLIRLPLLRPQLLMMVRVLLPPLLLSIPLLPPPLTLLLLPPPPPPLQRPVYVLLKQLLDKTKQAIRNRTMHVDRADRKHFEKLLSRMWQATRKRTMHVDEADRKLLEKLLDGPGGLASVPNDLQPSPAPAPADGDDPLGCGPEALGLLPGPLKQHD